jgi:ATP-dependent DNA helicase RecG
MLPDIGALLSQGMGTDLHWFPGDISATELAAALVGMANTRGGNVLLGVAPRSTRVQGLGDLEGSKDRVFQAALLADPPLVLPLPRQVEIDGKQLLWVTVPPGLPHVYSLNGRYLGRQGARTQPLPARGLRRLLLERGVVQFESQIPPGASLDDLDDDKIDGYLNALDLPKTEDVNLFLFRRGCLRSESGDQVGSSRAGDLQPTYAALLLFGKDPQQWLPNATILAARFAGTTMADQFIKQDISGTLPDQLRQAEAFVRENMSQVVRMDGLTRQEAPEYPLEAVRELLVNAVAHRDYNIQGDNIHLNIYSDRIEVHSPGGLAGPVNIDNLLQARFSRNAVIVQVLSDLGYVERLGYGLDRVMAVVRGHGLRPPQFEELAGTFRVNLLGGGLKASPIELDAYLGIELNPRQQLALEFLLQSRRITNREYQELCPDVSSETLRRDMVDLVERNLVIKVGDKRATYYILKQ